MTLREQNPTIFASRSMVQRRVNEDGGIDELKSKILQNCEDLIKMIEWNEKNGIKVFRISSNLFPHKTNPGISGYDFEFAKDILKRVGDLANKYNQRITMHPGQYNVVGSPSENAFRKTINDLEYQATVLDLMGMGKDSVMVVHGGGMYGDKEATKNRWCEQFYKLPENVQKRLVLENCEKSFHIIDCLEVSERINIPVVFDSHHHDCYIKMHPDCKLDIADTYIDKILQTWSKRGIKPKFHVSEQGNGRTGHHSNYVEVLPQYMLDIPKKHNTHVDIMIEAKHKELAVFHLYKKYPYVNCKKFKFKIKPSVKYIRVTDNMVV